jgi:hypothetical protein
MRTTIGFLGLLILTGCLGMAQQQPDNSDACKFNVRGDPVHATVTGPEDIVKLVHIIDQPDSPIEIVSVYVERNVALSFRRATYGAGLCTV